MLSRYYQAVFNVFYSSGIFKICLMHPLVFLKYSQIMFKVRFKYLQCILRVFLLFRKNSQGIPNACMFNEFVRYSEGSLEVFLRYPQGMSNVYVMHF